MRRYLRHIEDGTIYAWDEYLADNPLCEEVSEEQAFPQRFVKKEVVEKVKKTQKKKKQKLDLSTEEVPEEPAFTFEELGIEASRDLP